MQRKELIMYARTTVMQGRPDTMDAAAKIFAESVIPAAKQQHGFNGAYFLADPASGKGMSITLWETEADLKAGESSGYFKEQIAKFSPLLAGPPTREILIVAAMG
jgi:heme-degrading monooxygenase HmoA